MAYPYQYNSNRNILWGGLSHNKTLQETDSEHIVINVSHQEQAGTDYWLPLNDGVYDTIESEDNFAEAVNITRSQLQKETPVFVHCAYGQSRSVIVLATAISAETDTSLETVLSKMEESYEQVDPSPELRTKAETYLRHTN